MAQNNLDVMTSLFGSMKQPTFDQGFAAALPAFKGANITDITGAAAYAGGRGVGKGLMSAFGVEDPERKDANLVNGLAQQLQAMGVSPQSPEGLTKLAELLNANGRADLAQQAVVAAQNLKQKQTEEQLKQAQIKTTEAQGKMYESQAVENGRKVVLKQDSMGNVMVYDAATGVLIRVDRSPIFGMTGTPGINPAGQAPAAPTNRPPLSTFQR